MAKVYAQLGNDEKQDQDDDESDERRLFGKTYGQYESSYRTDTTEDNEEVVVNNASSLLQERMGSFSASSSFWDDDSSVQVPPSLTNDDRSLIDVLTDEMLHRKIPEYLEEFEILIPDAEVVVGSVPLEEVQQREQLVEEAKLRHAELEAQQYKQRELYLAQKEEIVRTKLLQEAQKKQDELVKKHLQFAEVMQLRTRRIGYVFQQAEAHLKHVIQQQQAQVHSVYGDLAHSRVPQSRKRYRVEWNKIPSTIKISAKMLKGVKDKLPRGHYVMVATLYDRLGGHALHWTSWDPESTRTNATTASDQNRRRPNFTLPFHHRGRFYNTEVVINQNLYVVCPSESLLRPGHTLVFELFHVPPEFNRRRRREVDCVVAWGAIPLSTPEFQVIEGKFKVPLLRGEMDPTMDKFRDMEQLYQEDLSAWLCNFYFHVTHLTKKTGSLNEKTNAFDVEIDERNGLLRVENNYERYMHQLTNRKGRTRLTADNDEDGSLGSSSLAGGSNNLKKPLSSTTLLLERSDYENTSTAKTQTKTEASMMKSKHESKKKKKKELNLFYHVPKLRWLHNSLSTRKKTRVYAGNKLELPGEEQAIDAHRFLVGHNDEEVVEKEAYRGEDEDEGEEDDSTSLLYGLDVENYKFAVTSSTSLEPARHKRFHMHRKLHYLRHELLVDLGLSNIHTLEFWRLLLLLLFALWLRIYVHYVAQWVFLRGYRIPVYTFQPQWTTCIVKYTWKTIATHTEIGVIVIGVLGNIVVFGFLALIAATSQAYIGELPHFGSSFIVCVGIAMVLDPLLVLLIDLFSHHYDCSSLSECTQSLSAPACTCVDGDAFKLYVRFKAQEGSGLVGIILTLILYVALIAVSLVAFYAYLLHIHMNARMLDVYRRIHAQEDAFFVPHDSEISLQELQTICTQATRWKSPKGTQRKVFVHEYVLTDPLDAHFSEKSVHIAVYNMEMDGSRELHRHFLKTQDGTILELFGEIGTNRHDGGTWQRDDAAGAVSSLTLLYNIMQDHQPPDAEPLEDQLAKLFDEL